MCSIFVFLFVCVVGDVPNVLSACDGTRGKIIYKKVLGMSVFKECGVRAYQHGFLPEFVYLNLA